MAADTLLNYEMFKTKVNRDWTTTTGLDHNHVGESSKLGIVCSSDDWSSLMFLASNLKFLCYAPSIQGLSQIHSKLTFI